MLTTMFCNGEIIFSELLMGSLLRSQSQIGKVLCEYADSSMVKAIALKVVIIMPPVRALLRLSFEHVMLNLRNFNSLIDNRYR